MSARGFLLDTNVVSETRKLRPDPNVIAFLAGADAKRLFLSVLTLGELHKCVAAKRRTEAEAGARLAGWLEGIEVLYADRILAVDGAIAKLWGELSARLPQPAIDLLLAATARCHGLDLVTRNVRHVTGTDVAVVNPWQPARAPG